MRIACAVAIAFLCAASPAAAQLYEVTHVDDPSWGAYFGGDAAYDPVHDCYFAISGNSAASGGSGPVSGRFLNRNGVTIGTVLFDTRRAPLLAEVAYSPHLSDGAGGFGGFLAIWNIEGVPGLFGQIVSLPVGAVGPRLTIRVPPPREIELHAGIAYSPVDHVFLIAVGVIDDADNHAFGNGNGPTRILRLNQNGQPIDEMPLSSVLSNSCFNFEFSLACNLVDVVWNPIANEFGVLYSQDREKILARVSANGIVLSRTPLGIFPWWNALAVNSTTGTYLALGGEEPSTIATTVNGAEVSPEGAVIGRGVVSSDFRPPGIGMRLSYATASGTFLVTGQGNAMRLLELNQHGVALSNMEVMSSIPVITTSHGTMPQWLVATSLGTRYIVGTFTRFGGSDARLPDCLTPDPFVALGGGTCINQGWYPPGMITPTPPPTPSPGGCLTPDPFVALGGGTCINGGWFPPDMTAPPPPPTPVPGGCITPDPFVALGGGRCVNGGWYPPGS